MKFDFIDIEEPQEEKKYRKVVFGDLSIGDVFILIDEPYIKVETIETGYADSIAPYKTYANAVRLGTGGGCWVDDETKVGFYNGRINFNKNNIINEIDATKTLDEYYI